MRVAKWCRDILSKLLTVKRLIFKPPGPKQPINKRIHLILFGHLHKLIRFILQSLQPRHIINFLLNPPQILRLRVYLQARPRRPQTTRQCLLSVPQLNQYWVEFDFSRDGFRNFYYGGIGVRVWFYLEAGV